MDLTQIFTPEMKAAVSTLAGAAGLETALGIISNKYVKHQSFVVGAGSKIFKALAVVFSGLAKALDMAQEYGGKVSVEVEPKGETDASG